MLGIFGEKVIASGHCGWGKCLYGLVPYSSTNANIIKNVNKKYKHPIRGREYTSVQDIPVGVAHTCGVYRARATDSGSGVAHTCGGLLSGGLQGPSHRFRIWICTCLSFRKDIEDPSTVARCLGKYINNNKKYFF